MICTLTIPLLSLFSRTSPMQDHGTPKKDKIKRYNVEYLYFKDSIERSEENNKAIHGLKLADGHQN